MPISSVFTFLTEPKCSLPQTVFTLLLLIQPFSGLYAQDKPAIPSYAQVAVFELPEPPDDIEALSRIATIANSSHSLLLKNQMRRWVGLYPQEIREKLAAMIGGPWSASEGSALSSTGVLPGLCGRETRNWYDARHYPRLKVTRKGVDEALSKAKATQHPQDRDALLMPLLESRSTAPDFGLVLKINEELLPLVSKEGAAHWRFEHPLGRLYKHWPAEAMARALEAAGKSAQISQILDSEHAHFFGDIEEALAFQRRWSYDAFYHRTAAHSYVEGMSAVECARNAEKFLCSPFLVFNAEASEVLLRQDKQMGKRLAALSAQGVSMVLEESFIHHDPVAAFSWLKSKPGFDARKDHYARDLSQCGPVPITDFVSLCNELEDPKAAEHIDGRFNPLVEKPEAFATALLTLQNRKAREHALRGFAIRWMTYAPAGARAWGESLVPGDDRELWLKTVGQFKDSDRENIPESEVRLFSEEFARSFFPFRLASHPAVKPGIDGWRERWTQLADPGVDVTEIDSLCAEILALKPSQARRLLEDFVSMPARNASEWQVQRLLVERWALDEPEAAAVWLIHKAPGYLAQALPLALQGMAAKDHRKALDLVSKIPNEWLHRTSLVAILWRVGLENPRLACDLAFERMHGSTMPLTRWWASLDAKAAKAWNDLHWRSSLDFW